MQQWIVISLISFWMGSGQAWAANRSQDSLLEAYVSTEKAFIWRDPGFRWTDCRPLEPDQPENQYIDDEDRRATLGRFRSGGEDVCKARHKTKDLLSAGDAVEILKNEKGETLVEVHPVLIGGEHMPKKFYKVRFKDRMGWMSEDQLTTPSVKEQRSERVKEDSRYCPPRPKHNGDAKGLALQFSSLQDAVGDKVHLAKTKTTAEINRYMCLYRDRAITDDAFPKVLAQMQKYASKAASAFGIPYGMIMCTMLVESGLHFNPQESDEYKGLGQFGSALVADLKKLRKRAPYKEMWDKYQSAIGSSAEITDAGVRSSGNPVVPVAAIALTYQWMYWDRIQMTKCDQCSMDKGINRKEMYMMVAGYNWTPYGMHQLAPKSPGTIRNSFPPPKESRDYMSRMENCLESGYDRSFREERRPKQPLRKLASEKKGISPKGEDALYLSRVEACNKMQGSR